MLTLLPVPSSMKKVQKSIVKETSDRMNAISIRIRICFAPTSQGICKSWKRKWNRKLKTRELETGNGRQNLMFPITPNSNLYYTRLRITAALSSCPLSFLCTIKAKRESWEDLNSGLRGKNFKFLSRRIVVQ